MKYLSRNLITALLILPLLSSCGKSGSGGGAGGSGQQREEEPNGSVDGSTIDGLYMAKFETLNPHVNGTIPGSLTFFRDGDKLMTYVRLFAGKPKAWHQQGVYLGNRCPNLGDDKNGDGFIDIEEAMAVVGKMIIPLDANMNSQSAGRNFYPLADLSGYYHYERVSSFRRTFEDLYDEDGDPEDHITKLPAGKKFTFEGKVVIVQGVSEDTILPESVVGLGRRRNFQTLPITCGIIKKVKATPGLPEHGEIPGPVAEVEEGQDRPAPPEAGEGETGGGTVAGTTGTNDTNDGEVGDEGGSAAGTTGGTAGGTTGGSSGRSTGGFIGGFIGGSSGGRNTTGGTSGGATTGGTSGRTAGGFIGGFIGGSSGGRTTSGSTTGESTSGSTTGESTSGSTTGESTTGSTTGGTTGA